MNIWDVIKVITVGVIFGVFVIACPLVCFLNVEPTMTLGVWSGVSGVIILTVVSFFKAYKK